MSLDLFFAEAYLALWLFFIYSFAGVIVEMIYCWTIEYKGVIESRLGLLYLPFNLLYGTGGVIITLVLVPYFDNPLIIFGLGLVVGTAYRRVEQKNAYLEAKKAGQDATLPSPAWGRLVDRLVPDVVLVNTFPRMSLITQYQELSGRKRKLIVWNPHIGKTTALRREAGERAERHAQSAAGA